MIDFDTLEFSAFRARLHESFGSAFAKAELSRLTPLDDLETILRLQGEYSEAIEFSGTILPIIGNDDDFYQLFPKIDDPFFGFSPLDFVVIKGFLVTCRELKRAMTDKKPESLKEYLSGIHVLSTLADEIGRKIDDNGEIKDTASNELRTIRKSLEITRRRVQDKLNSLLFSEKADKFVQDKMVVTRNGRYTIPCKTNFRQYMEGIVHDRSNTGQTFYVEPSSAVPLNNEYQTLKLAEEEEMVRIIRDLAEKVLAALPEMSLTAKNYGTLVFRLEVGRFYSATPFCFPEFGNEIRLNMIHHPLLYLGKRNDSIAIDFLLETKEHTAVITGPNTGGKTAALKSVGLNHIVGKCGLPLFGKFARLMNCTAIRADIGDKQSLVMDLSTFSSHLLNIRDILNEVKPGTLVLLDEVGTGTEPREGAALAVAILRHLKNAGATCMVTTHFSEVKNYALTEDSAAIFTVDYDYETFEPKYRLIKGVVGKSDPLVVARRLGFLSEILEDAEEQVSQFRSSIEVTMEEINRIKAETDRERQILTQQMEEFEAREEDLTRKEKNLAERLGKKERELLEETYAFYQRGKRLAEEKIKKVDVESVKKELETVSKKLDNAKQLVKPVADLKVGDMVFLEKYSKTGKVLSIEGNRVHIDLEGMKVHMQKRDIVGKKLQEETQKKPISITGRVTSSARREIILIGKRVEEALDILDQHIDDSLLAGYDTVFVVHGRGSGQLRKGIHEHLRTDRRVKGYRLAETAEGGNAITVISL